MTAPRFEVVRTDADQPWHARFRAANGRIVWTTETYARRGAAVRAVEALAGRFIHWSNGKAWVSVGRFLEVRYVDERVTSHA